MSTWTRMFLFGIITLALILWILSSYTYGLNPNNDIITTPIGWIFIISYGFYFFYIFATYFSGSKLNKIEGGGLFKDLLLGKEVPIPIPYSNDPTATASGIGTSGSSSSTSGSSSGTSSSSMLSSANKEKIDKYMLRYIDEISRLTDEKKKLEIELSKVKSGSSGSSGSSGPIIDDLERKLVAYISNKSRSNKELKILKEELSKKDVLTKNLLTYILNKISSSNNKDNKLKLSNLLKDKAIKNINDELKKLVPPASGTGTP
jgi:hypothetical protein